MTEKLRIESDKAIETEKKDDLGRGKFVGELANLIKNYINSSSECLTMDISGEWGEGKTSVINLLKEKFEKKEEEYKDLKCKFIDFNPWETSSRRENIEDELYKEIVKNIEVRNYGGLKNRLEYIYLSIARFIEKYSIYFIYIISSLTILYFSYKLIKKLTEFFLFYDYFFCISSSNKNDILNTLNLIIPIIGSIYGLFKYYYYLIDKKETVKSILDNKEKKEENTKKEETNNKDKKETTYILIIDDIDRLNKKQIIKLFDFIKSNIDLPHFIINPNLAFLSKIS